MNNYYQNYGGQCSSSDYNPNNYDLWQNSHYYNTNNFGLHNIFFSPNFGWTGDSGAPKTSDKEPEDVDIKKRRIIPRKALYEDPDAFYSQEDSADSKRSGHDWTQHHWRKEGEAPGDLGTEVKQNTKINCIQKSLNAALAVPVTMSKAERYDVHNVMMQKMGWSGGALGKDGDGIVEPIAPNAVYATKTIGFGQTEPETPKRFRKESFNKTNFKTNVLLHLLDFVKNDTETEVVFDRRLTKEERKSVHKIVNDVIGGLEEEELVEEIGLHNNYVLGTQSEGVFPDRQLVLYKEAPAHVYLVTPDDLAESDENAEANETTEKSEGKESVKTCENVKKSQRNVKESHENSQANIKTDNDEETNPFLRSITRKLREKDVISNKLEVCNITNENQPYVLKKITEYFIEFATNDEYTKFRFLGPFLVEDIKILCGFIEDVRKFIAKEANIDIFKVNKEKLLEIFGNEKYCFEVKEDLNGSLLISKQTKDALKEPDKS